MAPRTNEFRTAKQYTNRDGPGGSTIDYGPRKGSQQDSFDQKREKYGDSPWFGDQGNPLPWSGPDGQQRGQRTPFYTPDAGNPANDAYYTQETPEQQALWQAGNDQRNAAQSAAYGANPAMAAARGAGDVRGYIQAMQAMKQQGQQQRFIDQGGSAETWQGRNDTAWPVPRSPSGNYQYGPGRPGPTPPGVSRGGASGGGGAPPQRGPIEIEGYQPSGGGGGFPRGGRGTGGGMTGTTYEDPMFRRGGDGGFSKGDRGTGGGETRPMYDNWMSYTGGRTPPWGLDEGFSKGGMGTGGGMKASTYEDPMFAQGGRTPPWGPDGGFNPPSFDRFPPGTPPFNVGGGGGGRPIDFENPTGGQPWNGPQQQFRPGQFQGQMPIERMGGMQQFGYRPTGGGY